jgi:hypothetical protein
MNNVRGIKAPSSGKNVGIKKPMVRRRKLKAKPSIGKPLIPALAIIEKYSWAAIRTMDAIKKKNNPRWPYKIIPSTMGIAMIPLITRSKFFS